MENLLFKMLLSHFIGDYVLQNNFLALNKSSYKKIGWLTCLLHCFVYTLAVCGIMQRFSWQWVLLVFISHFVIDKFSLADTWLSLIKGRSMTRLMQMYRDIPPENMPGLRAADLLYGGFTTVVYTITDNTFHLIIMYYGLKLIGLE